MGRIAGSRDGRSADALRRGDEKGPDDNVGKSNATGVDAAAAVIDCVCSEVRFRFELELLPFSVRASADDPRLAQAPS
ncbi:MAG: hypothetical protein CME06_14870 [Gemmatimonadetes bacterium]|nr:hypothetical protein [Gemmatimonadota bacterium]